MKTWLRWAFYYDDGKYSYGMWNNPDADRAKSLQLVPNIERVEIHGKTMGGDQSTNVLASLKGEDYKKIVFDMSQIFIPSSGMSIPKMSGMRLVNKNGEEIKVKGE